MKLTKFVQKLSLFLNLLPLVEGKKKMLL